MRSALASIARVLVAAAVVLSPISAEAQVPSRPPNRPPGPTSQRTLKDAPPHPLATDTQGILANLLWGLVRTRMDPQLESDLRSGRVIPHRILDVQAETTPSDYYYVAELDRQGGGAFRDVLISKDGWLWGIARYTDGRRHVAAPDLLDVAERLTAVFGPTNARYYHAGNDLETGGGSFFLPLIKAETPQGTVYVTSDRRIYIQRSLELYTTRRDEGTRDLGRKRPRHTWLVTKQGIVTIEKIGELPGK